MEDLKSVKSLLEEGKSVIDISNTYRYDDPYVFLADYYKTINDYAINVGKDIRFIFEHGYSMDQYFDDHFGGLYGQIYTR